MQNSTHTTGERAEALSRGFDLRGAYARLLFIVAGESSSSALCVRAGDVRVAFPVLDTIVLAVTDYPLADRSGLPVVSESGPRRPRTPQLPINR